MSKESAETTGKQLVIQKIYLKDVSFESPNSPELFSSGQWKPEINVQLNTEGKALGTDVYDVTLMITVTAKHDEKTAFLAEVKQAGIFAVKGFSSEEMAPMIGSYCPNVLFPYAREAISDLVTKGGFPQLLLAPVNFDAIYAQHVQQQKQAAEGQAKH